MNILIKLIFLQLFWLIAIKSSVFDLSWLLWPMAVFITFTYLYLSPNKQSLPKNIFLTLLFTITGAMADSFLIMTQTLSFEHGVFWINSLWVIFILYYDDVFVKFNKLNWKLNFLIGAIGGTAVYYAGVSIAQGVYVNPDKKLFFLCYEFIIWGTFFPLSIKLYYKHLWWDKLLDKLIYFSFDQTGFERHKKYFTEQLADLDYNNKNFLITGGTSGIGEITANFLKDHNAHTFIVGRKREKGELLAKSGHHFINIDMSNWDQLKKIVDVCPVLDGIVLNAGAMPESYKDNEYGIELQAASQLVGHYLLLRFLIRKNKLVKGAKVIWVTSGGMYLSKLNIETLFTQKVEAYNKVSTYAHVKRAQVTLVQELSRCPEFSDYIINTMHPGWVATPGLKNSINGFYKFTQNRLRDVLSGADTILWLLGHTRETSSGQLYFDRKIVSPYLLKTLSPDHESRDNLLKSLNEIYEDFIKKDKVGSLTNKVVE